MTRKSSDPRATDAHMPYGAQTPRRKGPLVLWGVLYLCWLALLVWMAVFRTGN